MLFVWGKGVGGMRQYSLSNTVYSGVCTVSWHVPYMIWVPYRLSAWTCASVIALFALDCLCDDALRVWRTFFDVCMCEFLKRSCRLEYPRTIRTCTNGQRVYARRCMRKRTLLRAARWLVQKWRHLSCLCRGTISCTQHSCMNAHVSTTETVHVHTTEAHCMPKRARV
jgi:hypothetical protein